MLRRALAIAAFLLLATPAWATTYYTAKDCSGGSAPPACSNSNNGTSRQTAKLTIAAGIGLMSGGDTLIIGDGTYNETINNSIPSGSAGFPTVIQAEHANLAIIRSSSPAPGSYQIYINNLSYITFNGIYSDCLNGGTDCNPFELGQSGDPGSTANHIIIQNGTITNGMGVFGSGIDIGAYTHDSQVLNNTISNNGSGSGAHGVYIQGGSNIIDGNNMVGNSGYCGQINDHGEGNSNNNIFRRNSCHGGITRGGFIFNTGTANYAYNNIDYGNPFSFIVRTNGNFIYFNTFYNNSNYCIDLFNSGIVTTGNTVRNNICYLNSTNSINDSGAGNTKSNNLTASNPMFTNAGAADFSLAIGSPAIAAGVAVAAVQTDYYGFTRPNPPSEGAIEINGVPVTTPAQDTLASYSAGTALESLANGGTGFLATFSKVAANTVTVENAPSGLTGKAIKSAVASAGNFADYTRPFNGQASGFFDVILRSSVTNNNNHECFILGDGINQNVDICFESNATLSAFDGLTQTFIPLVSTVANANNQAHIEWNNSAQPNQYRVQINGGTFTSWLGVDSSPYATLASMEISDRSTNTHDFWVAYPNGVSRITSISPNTCVQGGTCILTITGSGSTWSNGTTACTFNDSTNITVNSTTVASATSASCNITVGGGASVTARDLYMTTTNEIEVMVGALNITAAGTPVSSLGLRLKARIR